MEPSSPGEMGAYGVSMIGRILGNRYKLISELGSGGMAWVYLAQDLRKERQVAIKILYPHLAQDAAFFQRFSQEAKLATSLSQAAPEMHVVTVLDYGSDRDVHYLVMEYVPGRDLRQVLDQWGALTWQEALDIGRQVALALGHAHQHGIVHRDVKPENIMLLPDGVVRVLDFGVARARTSPALTHSGFVGSPYYAAPEQAMGRPVDIRADLYSLGIVLYEMITGVRPFQSDTPWAVINCHIASPPPMLEDSLPALPRSVGRLVRKAMAKRPEDRFQSPGEMVQAIETVLAGQELSIEVMNVEPDILAPLLAGLYQRARQAAAEGAWQEAVDLFGQILKVDPRYRDVADQLAEAGRQARLAALYAAAKQTMRSGDWAAALAQLEEIAEMSPGYLQSRQLVATARAELRKQRANHTQPSRWPLLGSGPERTNRRHLLWGIVGVLLLVLAVEGYLFYRTQQPRAIAAVPSLSQTRVVAAQDPPVADPPFTATARSAAARQSPSAIPVYPTGTDTATTEPSETALAPLLTPLAAASATATPTLPWVPTTTPTSQTAPIMSEPLSGQIAFPRFDPVRGTYDVYACRVDGIDCRLLAREASQPDFLPDGSGLVLHLWKADEKGLVLLTLAGRQIWRISTTLEAARPSVDSKGGSYVYHSREESDRLPRIFRTYGAETRPILHDAGAIAGQSPCWLPDGRILYSGCWQDACGLIVMHADGTFPQQVVAGSSDTNPEASPDDAPGGSQVAFMSRRDDNWEVYVVNTDGSELRRLTNDPANDGLPTWSPDGRHIAFVSDRTGRWAVWAMRPDGSEQQHLFDIGGPLDGRVQQAAAYDTNGWVEERISWAPLP
jgi:tetratricopeptide (TPR) repeat protein